MNKKAYVYDNQGHFVREEILQIDPRATAAAGYEVFLMPIPSTMIEPPAEKEGFNRVFTGDSWEYEPEPQPEPEPEPTPEELRAAEITACKAYLYETDYVVLKIAEGVATPADYPEELTKRKEMREIINQLEAEQCGKSGK